MRSKLNGGQQFISFNTMGDAKNTLNILHSVCKIEKKNEKKT